MERFSYPSKNEPFQNMLQKGLCTLGGYTLGRKLYMEGGKNHRVVWVGKDL